MIWLAREVDVLDAQAAALEQAQAGAVEQRGHQPRRAVAAGASTARDLVAREHDGSRGGALGAHELVEPRQLGPEDVAVQEQEGASAWFCVEAATRPAVARALRERVTSAAPISRGWRLPWNRMKRRIQPT